MTTFARTYTDDQRQAIYELKAEGLSGPATRERCRQGTKGLEPFSPTVETVNRIFNEERAAREDADLSPTAKLDDTNEAFRQLVKQTISLTDRQVAQLRRDVARAQQSKKPEDRQANAKTTEALVGALVRLRKLIESVPAKPERNGKPEQEPVGFLEGLAGKA